MTFAIFYLWTQYIMPFFSGMLDAVKTWTTCGKEFACRRRATGKWFNKLDEWWWQLRGKQSTVWSLWTRPDVFGETREKYFVPQKWNSEWEWWILIARTLGKDFSMTIESMARREIATEIKWREHRERFDIFWAKTHCKLM